MSVAQTLGRAAASIDAGNRAAEFLQIARALVASRSASEASRFLRSRATDRAVTALETRAAVPPGMTSDSSWSSLTQYELSSEAFAETLRSASAFDRILSDGGFLRLPAGKAIAITTAGATATLLSEADVKPPTQLSFTSAELQMVKIAAYVVLSDELARSAGVGPLRLLDRELRGAIAVLTDSYFVAQITSGLTAIPSPGVPSATSVRADLRALLDSTLIDASSKLYFLAGSPLVKRLAVIGDSAGAKAFPGTTPMGGSLEGVPLLSCDAVAASTLILLDANQIAISAGPFELDQSSAAMLNLATPADSPPTAATVQTSLWPANLSALRLERFLACERLRTTAVSLVSGITGIGNSPS